MKLSKNEIKESEVESATKGNTWTLPLYVGSSSLFSLGYTRVDSRSTQFLPVATREACGRLVLRLLCRLYVRPHLSGAQ